MPIVLEIDNGDNMGRVDFTRYLASPDRTPPALQERINLPSLLDFVLVPADQRFVTPRRGAYVRLTGLTNSLPAGGPRVPGPLFTGYITSEPSIDFIGASQSGAVHGYRCQATSEEYLLNVKRLGVLPPFLNQTAGAILRFLAEYLQPGRFDLSAVSEGTLIPHYVARPEQSWSEIAHELAERAGYFYRVLDGAIQFQAIGSEPAGLTVDEGKREFRPEALTVTPLGNPVHNDVTVFGAVEPQAYVKEYFVGDGFTSRFPLVAPVFGAESSRLLADDFTGAAVNSLLWSEADPNEHITPFDGRLNITGGTGILGETVLSAQQAVELGGELELIHGEFEFVGASTGIIGGLYSGAAFDLANCLIGFDASPIGNTTRLRAVIAGIVQPPEVIVQSNHHYVLRTRLSSAQPFRTQQTFVSQGSSFGGLSIPSLVQVEFEVVEIDLADPEAAVTTVLHEASMASLPAAVLYAPVNSSDLHVAMNFLQVTRPLQASLTTQAPGSPQVQRSLGFGIAGHHATITSDPNRNQWALEFYEDTIPALGEKVTLVYRGAGRARARVRDDASIATEAVLAGDNGVRAVVLSDVNPMPRTSSEAELAAQAYLADHVAARYEGQYSTWSLFAEGWPRCGAMLTVNNPSRYPAFTALVRSVVSEFRELASEQILHTVDFGDPSRFEDLLKHFSSTEGVLDTGETLSIEPIDTSAVGTHFIADAGAASLASVNTQVLELEMGLAPPSGGSYEVRRGDLGWGSPGQAGTAQNLLGGFTSASFQLPRTGRNQTFYIRPVASTGETSRYSTVLAVHYPLLPAPPNQVLMHNGVDEEGSPIIAVTVELDESAIADVNSIELRDEDNTAVLSRWDFGQLRWEAGFYRVNFTFDNSVALARSRTMFAYTVNTLGEYSGARVGMCSLPQPTKPTLATGNSIGQVLEILLDTYNGPIVETQIQAAGPAGSFSTPAQDVVVLGQPEKFNFVATQSGGWGFRARRRDSLGWSPWSDEPQGQIPAQLLIFSVEFFQAHELDPSVGAAVNGQNLLPNAEFFLGGIAGQEGIHAPRYFSLVNAAANGSEVDYSATTNEVKWKSGVSFAASNPGFRSMLSNMGRLFNPGESLTLSAGMRQNGTGVFSHAIRMAIRSAATPSFDQWQDVTGLQMSSDYGWFSVAFTLPAGQAVPDDLAAEITVVAPAGQSLNADLFCDKIILNRGHRPAAFSLAPWDVIALAWNGSAYDLPATIAGGTPRSSDPGNAGRLSGTGTEDLDPGFTDRYLRLTA